MQGLAHNCTPLTGGGSLRSGATANLVTVYYDTNCTKPYLATSPSTTMTLSGGNLLVIAETATYYGPTGTILGTMTLNETAQLLQNSANVYGLGLFTPATGAKTPVQLGVYCTLTNTTGACAGAIAQNFPALGLAIGAVTPMNLSVSSVLTAPVTFTGGGTAVTGPIGSLTLTNPTPTSLVISGGTNFATTTASGGAAQFVLFPPTPTAWTLTDSTHDQQFRISVIDNTTRNLTLTIAQVSSGATLATGTLDQSGTGTITYSDGSTAAITNWTLAN